MPFAFGRLRSIFLGSRGILPSFCIAVGHVLCDVWHCRVWPCFVGVVLLGGVRQRRIVLTLVICGDIVTPQIFLFHKFRHLWPL
jgi:hypothetical protein